jgi:hypothetical protein
MATQQRTPQQITINTADEMSRGRFSNTMFVAHSPEEFVIDWMNNSPNGMHLVSRIIVTPGHMKRILAALSDNMSKYEEKYGSVTAIDPSQQKFN